MRTWIRSRPPTEGTPSLVDISDSTFPLPAHLECESNHLTENAPFEHTNGRVGLLLLFVARRGKFWPSAASRTACRVIPPVRRRPPWLA
ncbi:hypothetical protein [Aeoliella mucimassa]|uniref:hypothetical protein n=1 Tax=Aeoliella mucimassa TaxID=2527972 RepID=UPI001E549F23|nr:hypothetical protein [Aeoliella mucimassa]